MQIEKVGFNRYLVSFAKHEFGFIRQSAQEDSKSTFEVVKWLFEAGYAVLKLTIKRKE